MTLPTQAERKNGSVVNGRMGRRVEAKKEMKPEAGPGGGWGCAAGN